jgi:hypothetical protein
MYQMRWPGPSYIKPSLHIYASKTTSTLLTLKQVTLWPPLL